MKLRAIARIGSLGMVLFGGGLTHAAEALSEPCRLEFDSAGALRVNGKPVFPITLTIIPSPEGKTPSCKPAYAEFAEAGVLFMRTGGPRWDEETILKETGYQQAAARNGLRCSPWLGWELSNIRSGDTKKEQQLRDILIRFKGSPGLGLWKGADEPDWGKKSPAEVAHTASIIHEVDPDHPIWLVQAPRGTVESLRRYDKGWDVGGIDIYPVSYPPGRHTEGTNKELSMVGDFTRMMREVAGRKPFWMTLQIAFSGTTPPKGIIRFPTFFEQRFMAYQAIINGARGLTFFGGGLGPTLSERDRQLGWNWTYWERVMRPLLAEIGSGSALDEALVAPDSDVITVRGEAERPGGKVSSAEGIECVGRRAGSVFYLLACCKEGPTVRVRFQGLPKEVTVGQVLFEEPREVTAAAGSFSDWFAEHDVHVYRFAVKSNTK